MKSEKQLLFRGLAIFACCILCGCGGWIPARKASLDEAFPWPMAPGYLLAADIPPGSYDERTLETTCDAVYEAAEKSVGLCDFTFLRGDKRAGVILATFERLLDPPPDLLNCPNNHYSNSKPQPWTYYLGIAISSAEAGATRLRVSAKTQGRCFKGGGCFGHDSCPDYAAVHWALGYESAEQQITQFLKTVGRRIEKP
jgi:hypothetical protein